MVRKYDLIIVGGGPGGLTAGIYAKRAGLNCVIIEKGPLGGTLNITHEVSNYTGFKNITGPDLAERMLEHAKEFDIPFIADEVVKISLEKEDKVVKCFHGQYRAKAVILGLGSQFRRLNLNNEAKYLGKGISYCASCDGNLFKGKDVAIVGGGNTALEDGSYLAGIVKTLYVIHRRGDFTGEKYLRDRIKTYKNVKYLFNSEVVGIEGEKALSKIYVKNLIKNQEKHLDVSALFICIGRGPDTEILDFEIKKDKLGYIVTDQEMQTSVEGVYAIGDIRATPLRQIITACADGAIAATKCLQYIKGIKK